MNIQENESDKENGKKDEESADVIQISVNIEEDKYIIKIYSSKDNSTIIFKVEQENIQTFYFYEKFDLRDFKQKNKEFISNENIYDVFNTLKNIIEKSSTKLEKQQLKMNITFSNKSGAIANFSLRKKLVSQNRLNTLLVEQIQENKSKLKALKKQAIKFDKLLQNHSDIITNINGKIDLINNNIKYIINDINIINSTIKNPSQNEEINNLVNNNEVKIKSNKKNNSNNKEINKESINNNKNSNKGIVLDEKKEDFKYLNYKNAIHKLEKKNQLLFLFDVAIFFFIIYYFIYCNRFNNGLFIVDKLKGEKLEKIMSFFDFVEKFDGKEFNYLESKIKKSKDKNENKNIHIKYNNKSNYIIDKFKYKIKNISNNNKIPIIAINNDISKEDEQIESSIKSMKSSESKIENNSTKSNSINNENKIEEKEYKNKINESKDDVKNEENKNEKFILEKEDEINYFKSIIKQRAKYKVKEVNLVLKYKSDDLSYNNFFNNCKSISENLVLIKNQEGKKIGIISKNIIGILNNILNNKNLTYVNNNFLGYIFNQGNIEELNFKEFFGVYEAFISIFKEMFNFLNKEKQFNEGQYLANLDFVNFKNYIGVIEKIEIYQIKYLIK
jgi:hypothetical protein